MGCNTMSENTIKLWNIYRLCEPYTLILYFSSLSEKESMDALKFGYQYFRPLHTIIEDVNVDDLDLYLDYNTNEKNELGLRYNNHKQGEQDAGTTTTTTI